MNDTAYGNPYSVAQADVQTRASFIRKVYMHLAGAILALVAIEAVLLTSPIADRLAVMMTRSGMNWLVVMGAFMVVSWMATTFASNPKSKGMQYLGLGLYTFAWALMLLPLLLFSILKSGDYTIIKQASVCTGAIFAALTMVAFVTKADFSFFRGFLMVGGVIALGTIVCGIAFGFNLGLWFSAAMVLFASISILYNTSNIIHHYSSDQYVAASLSLFGSIAMLFWYIAQIFMSRD